MANWKLIGAAMLIVASYGQAQAAAFGPETWAQNDWRMLRAPAVAWLSKEVLKKAVALMGSGDKVAAAAYMDEQMGAGMCSITSDSKKVHLEQFDDVYSCVRPQGQTECVWVIVGALE